MKVPFPDWISDGIFLSGQQSPLVRQVKVFEVVNLEDSGVFESKFVPTRIWMH